MSPSRSKLEETNPLEVGFPNGNSFPGLLTWNVCSPVDAIARFPCHMLVEWPTWVATPIPGFIVGFVCRCCNSCAKPDFSFSKVSIGVSDSNAHKIQKIGQVLVVCELWAKQRRFYRVYCEFTLPCLRFLCESRFLLF